MIGKAADQGQAACLPEHKSRIAPVPVIAGSAVKRFRSGKSGSAQAVSQTGPEPVVGVVQFRPVIHGKGGDIPVAATHGLFPWPSGCTTGSFRRKANRLKISAVVFEEIALVHGQEPLSVPLVKRRKLVPGHGWIGMVYRVQVVVQKEQAERAASVLDDDRASAQALFRLVFQECANH